MLLFWCSRSVTSHPPAVGSSPRGSFAGTPQNVFLWHLDGDFSAQKYRYALVLADGGAAERGGGGGENVLAG